MYFWKNNIPAMQNKISKRKKVLLFIKRYKLHLVFLSLLIFSLAYIIYEYYEFSVSLVKTARINVYSDSNFSQVDHSIIMKIGIIGELDTIHIKLEGTPKDHTKWVTAPYADVSLLSNYRCNYLDIPDQYNSCFITAFTTHRAEWYNYFNKVDIDKYGKTMIALPSNKESIWNYSKDSCSLFFFRKK